MAIKTKKLPTNKKKLRLLAFVVLFAITGVTYLFITHAATDNGYYNLTTANIGVTGDGRDIETTVFRAGEVITVPVRVTVDATNKAGGNVQLSNATKGAIEITAVSSTATFKFLGATCAPGIQCLPGTPVATDFDQTGSLNPSSYAKRDYATCINVFPVRSALPIGVNRVALTLKYKVLRNVGPGVDVDSIYNQGYSQNARLWPSSWAITVACGEPLTTDACNGFDHNSFDNSNGPEYCRGQSSSPGYTPGGKTPGPGTGGTTGKGAGSGGQGTGKSGSSKSPTQSTGGGGSSATKQGDKSKTTPSTSAQGNQKNQTKLDPSPFYDGKEYKAGSDKDKGIKGALNKAGRNIVKLLPYIAGVLLLTGLGIWWWVRRRHQSSGG